MELKATYFANYEDYNGYDEVPCIVDSLRKEVIRFGKPIASRWGEPGIENIMCIEETIVVEEIGGKHEYAAVKSDEWMDIELGYSEDVYGGRDAVIIFDNDMLVNVLSDDLNSKACPEAHIKTAGDLVSYISANGLENMPIAVGCEGYVSYSTASDEILNVCFDGHNLVVYDSGGGYPFVR